MHSSSLIDVTVEFTSSADDNEDIPDSPIPFLKRNEWNDYHLLIW